MNQNSNPGTPPIPELLAPAGSPACALAAFEAGADAIYAGLAKFNARERGENFTPDSMARIIEHAHKLGRKVYITLNTLVKEQELPEVAETLAALEEMGPDALLVQDLGIIRMAREYFPKLVLHASTQMGFHNSAGLEVAEKLGLRRVVLERQMTLEEIAEVRKNTKLELEVFVHGALCASLSGACLFSSYLGGYSGNRGKCKQPCRRRYYAKDGNGFFFSPQDLCSAELLPQLRELGVQSLKIEGRLRQPDYVRQTVGAYRLLLDSPPEEFHKRLGEARNMLSKGCGRKWSAGFYTKESAETLISHDSLGAAGQLCGNVSELRENGFGFTSTKRLFLGDRLRVQPLSGDEGPALTVTKMFVDNAPARRALPGQHVVVLCDKPMAPGGLVFKIGESFPDYAKELAALPPPREKLNLDLRLTATKIEIEAVNAPFPHWEKALDLKSAESHPVTAETLAKEFAAADSEKFALGALHCRIDGNYFLPASELKSLRREFWEAVKAALVPGSVFRDSATGLEQFRRAWLELKPAYALPEHLTETVATRPNGAEPGNRKAIRACSLFDFSKLTDEAILPEFSPEERVETVRRAIRSAVEAGIRRFRVTSLYGLALLGKTGAAEIIASPPLPVCNSMAALELSRFGVTRVTAHIELERAAVEALRDKSLLPVELFRYGRPVLLVSRARIPAEGDLSDARGNAFVVRFDKRSGLTRVYPQKIHSVPRLAGVFDYYDLQNAHWNSQETGTFNYDGNWF